MVLPYITHISNDYNSLHTIVTITVYKAPYDACSKTP